MTDVDTVRRELQDLAQWRPLLPATPSDAARVRGAGMGSGGFGPKRSESPAPGNVDRWIDTWFDNGPIGIHTQCGIHQAFGHWVDEIREWRASTIGPERFTPGEIPYLLAHLDWAMEHMPGAQWQFLAVDIHGVHDRVQHLVAPEKETVGECPDPECTGTIRVNTTRHGLAASGTCDTCGREYETDPEEFARQTRDVMRGLTVTPLATVTAAQAQHIWAGEITVDHVKKWVIAGKLHRIDTTPTTFNLRTINRLAHDLVERRRRKADKANERIAS